MYKILLSLFLFLSASLYPNHISIRKINNQTILEYTLDPQVTEEFNALFTNQELDPYKEWDFYKKFAKEALEKVLPADLKEIILSMRHSNYPTALIVHNMPIDTHIPPTPENGIRPPTIKEVGGKGYVSEGCLLGLCSMLNAYPDFDENEKDGTYINQIIPRDDQKSKRVASSNGSEVPFYAHTENVYSVCPLKFFSLLCLRGTPGVLTSMIFLEDILSFLKETKQEHIINEMKKPQFFMKSGPSFEGTEKREELLPILDERNGETIYRFNANPGRVVGIDENAESVVDCLRSILKSSEFLDARKVSINLQKGDLLLFNNWEVMHARDSFKIDKNNWRWLQRCYFMLNEFK